MERPIWFCISSDCREKLVKAQWHWHQRELRPPGYVPDIEESGQIPKIMTEAPSTAYQDVGR